MKIGMIVEGSYPYVSGGVANWVQMMIQRMPEHEFEIVAITPKLMTEKDYRYTLPENVTGVTNLPLNMNQKKKMKKRRLSAEEEEALTEWMMFRKTSDTALNMLSGRLGDPAEFFSSRLFWHIVQNSYEEEKQSASFIEYLFMWKGMFSPVIELLQFDFPEVDLVQSVSTGYAGLIGAAMKQQQDIPFILTEHGIYSREREEEILQAAWIADYYKERWVKFFHHLSLQAYMEADDVITLFERNSELQETLGAPAGKLHVVPNGIDYERLGAIQKSEKGKDTLIIGAIVRVVPIKDIKTMIQAAKLLAEKSIPFEMYIMGPLDEEEDYAEECRRLINQLELENSVFLTGKVNISDYLPTFDVCLLTSISEGQPLAVLEGMAAGVPWVVTDVGSCSELILGGEGDPYGPAGFVVPPVKPLQVAEKCEWMYAHPEETAKFGWNGKKRVETYYQLNQLIEQYRELYQRREEAYGRHRV
ncbi:MULTISPECIES: GT4 family glycosyltransferase PelF [Salimicrobium]|uniref:Glycoside hydrolase n=1 Tax=Salimicrobium humidisoli TaxID=2029857 RepID=A0ABX4HU31_9BACI|nr:MULTISPECIES: GT4 family glycosyltransferase PelF [Salimicrobium]PBB06588.1 glycoside hydrolase [Salimicrobium humidisoli]